MYTFTVFSTFFGFRPDCVSSNSYQYSERKNFRQKCVGNHNRTNDRYNFHNNYLVASRDSFSGYLHTHSYNTIILHKKRNSNV